eukprot:GHVP01021925.1.p1 GENE.GHVP01021925.1~~GHVP01021925.1.p1  ORF type:complete len:139 (-),score=19.63 GHVP01021925.1:27-443(-)
MEMIMMNNITVSWNSKKNSTNLIPALVQCSLYVLKDHMVRKIMSECIVNVSAVSVLNYQAQLGQLKFQLDSTGTILNCSLNIGSGVIFWDTEEELFYLIKHFFQETGRPVQIERQTEEDKEDQLQQTEENSYKKRKLE